MARRVAYLANGQIHVRAGEGPKTSFSSKFGEEVRDRAVRANRRHDWKRSGRGASFTGAMLAGAANDDPADMRIAITQIARGREANEILYVLETNEICGVFALDLESGDFADDGSILYTDGLAVYQLSSSGERQRLFRDDIIEQVLAI
jgi:hypothetical protein